MRQKKRKTTEKETRHQRHHDSLRVWNATNFDRRTDSSKTKQMTNWSVSTFKGKLKFFRFKTAKYKTRTFNRKFEIKPIPILHKTFNILLNANTHFWYCCPFFASNLMLNSTGYVVKHWFMLLAVHYRVMEHLGSLESTQEARVALGYRLGQLLRFFRALQTSRVLHNSIVHAKA